MGNLFLTMEMYYGMSTKNKLRTLWPNSYLHTQTSEITTKRSKQLRNFFVVWNRDDFKALLKLVKSFVLLIWETRKKELYGDQDCVVSGCSCSCPLTGGLTSSACVCGCVVNGVSATAAT